MLTSAPEARERRESLDEKKKIEATKETKSEALVIGVDLGQAYDYTAIVAVERVKITTFDSWRQAPLKQKIDLNNPLSEIEPVFNTSREYHVRLIERARLGVSYADIVKYILNLVNREGIKEKKAIIALDASGVGRAVFDMLDEAGIKHVKAITVTGGEKITDDDPYYNVPKSELASLVKGLFGRKIIKITKGINDADALTRELENFVIKKTQAGHVQYEAGSGHDDLVSALSLACFIAQEVEHVLLVAPTEIKRRDSDPSMRRVGRISRGSLSMSQHYYNY
jgi:DNA-binding Lrp family transcriptional regulator